jgi:hypothetical protein
MENKKLTSSSLSLTNSQSPPEKVMLNRRITNALPSILFSAVKAKGGRDIQYTLSFIGSVLAVSQLTEAVGGGDDTRVD